jgi:hypothetical protein
MTEAMRKEAGVSWLSVTWSARHDPARILNVDLLKTLLPDNTEDIMAELDRADMLVEFSPSGTQDNDSECSE